jgi:predicted esterase
MTHIPPQPLLVFVPDRTGRRESVRPLVDFLKTQAPFRDANEPLVCDFRMPWGWGHRDLSEVCSGIATEIDNRFESNRDTISNIILCGYSLGAMLVRRVFLDASGLGDPPGQLRPWAAAVDRIVLVGAVCRGFHSSRLSWPNRVGLWIACRFGLHKPLRSAFAGEPWASNVRLDWISYWQTHPTRPRVVNIRGSLDDTVYREDAVDIEKDPLAAYLEVSGDNHDSIVKPNSKNEALLLEAFSGDPPHREPPVEPPRERVYVLLHGMRSSKFFMAALEDELRKTDPAADVFRPSYGYIPLLSFLSRSYRHMTAATFTDEFIQRFAANPGARFFFAGHSNGTCLFGEAIYHAPRMRFERIYFGGSALPRSFSLNTIVKRGQVDIVRSDHGSEDWAVGILARAIESLSRRLPFLRGIGSAGYDGFDRGDRWLNEPWFPGDHSAMFANLDSIVEFLTAKTPCTLSQVQLPAPAWFRFLHKYGDLVIPAVVVLYLALTVRLLLTPVYPISFLPDAWGVSLAAVLVGLLVFVLRRF